MKKYAIKFEIEDITDSIENTDDTSVVICNSTAHLTIHTPDNVYAESYDVTQLLKPSIIFKTHEVKNGSQSSLKSSNDVSCTPIDMLLFDICNNNYLSSILVKSLDNECDIRDIKISGLIECCDEPSIEFDNAEIELLDKTTHPFIRLVLRPKYTKQIFLDNKLAEVFPNEN